MHSYFKTKEFAFSDSISKRNLVVFMIRIPYSAFWNFDKDDDFEKDIMEL